MYREDACELVEVDLDPEAAIVDIDDALADGAPLVHPGTASNVAGEVPLGEDPVLEELFASAAHVVTHTFRQQRYLCVPMETRGIISQWDQWAGTLDVRLSTQGHHGVRTWLARALDLDENRIRVVMGDVGGGFGQKMFMTPDEFAVVLAGRRLGRPVRWIEDRRENLMSGLHSRDDRVALSAAVDGEGHVLALRVELVENAGAFPAAGSSSIGFVGALITGPYKIGRVAYRGRSVYTNTCGRVSYRGPWMMETMAREQMMDLIARTIGLDPLELRRRNVVRDEDLPYTTASGMVYDAVSIEGSLEQAATMIGYDRRRAEAEAAARSGDGTAPRRGVGLGLYVEPSGLAMGSLASEGATVTVGVNGKVQVATSSSSHGQSVETTVAQVVADALGVDLADVVATQGDTASSPYGPGTGGSRSAVLVSGAAASAAGIVRTKLLDIAAHMLEAAPEDLEIEGGRVSVAGTPTRGIEVAEIARVAYIQPDRLPPGTEMGLEGRSRFTPGAPLTWSNSCHACAVEVDPVTGMVHIDAYVVSEDCGVMINPTVVEGQIAGGVVQGIGGALYEHMAYDEDGNPLATTFVDYLVPTAAEVPTIEYGHIETPAPTNPGGYKGMGEGGAIGSPPAVVNAVAAALAPLGVMALDPPLGPAQVVAAIIAAGG
jgi:carbon-monoxide dehydrogenase large subunit